MAAVTAERLNDMDTFSSSALLGYALAALTLFALPIAAFCMLRKNRAASLLSLLAGVIIWLLATRFNDICVQMLLRGQSRAMMTVAAAETVCLWEECGRWLAMRSPFPGTRSAGAAVSYGIGHAGIEAVIRGIGKVQIIGAGLRMNSEGIGALTACMDAERAANYTAQLQNYAAHGLFCSLLDAVDAAAVFGGHIALSLLIYRGIREENSRRTLPIAIGLHYLVNVCGWLGSLSGSDEVQSFMGIGSGVLVIWLSMKCADGWGMLDEIRFPPI